MNDTELNLGHARPLRSEKGRQRVATPSEQQMGYCSASITVQGRAE